MSMPTLNPMYVFFETTDKRKATKALHQKNVVIYSSPNMSELRAMAKFLSPKLSMVETADLNEILALSEIVLQIVDFIIVTFGAKGVVTALKSCNKLSNTLVAKYYPVEAVNQIENVSGAGDCFASGFIYGMLSGFKESQNVYIGFETAKQAIFSKNTVPNDLSTITTLQTNAKCLLFMKKL